MRWESRRHLGATEKISMERLSLQVPLFATYVIAATLMILWRWACPG
jgi:hypothetical protein